MVDTPHPPVSNFTQIHPVGALRTDRQTDGRDEVKMCFHESVQRRLLSKHSVRCMVRGVLGNSLDARREIGY